MNGKRLSGDNMNSFNVSDMLDLLDGHDQDREIKIKLCDGTTKNIAGFCFRNACIGGDDIIYIEEENPLKVKYGEEIYDLVIFIESIFDLCRDEQVRLEKKYKDDCDDAYVKTVMIGLCQEMDWYIKKCKLEKKVIEKIGFFEPRCGSDDEAYIKLEVLRDFIL